MIGDVSMKRSWLLTDVRASRTTGNWHADWRQAEDRALRVSVLGGEPTEVIACASPSNSSVEEKEDAIVARRWGSAAVFLSVWEPHSGHASIAAVRRLEHKGASGMQVRRHGGDDGIVEEVSVVSESPGRKQCGRITFDGQAASVRRLSETARISYAHLVHGVWLECGKQRLVSNAPATIYVESKGAEGLDGVLVEARRYPRRQSGLRSGGRGVCDRRQVAAISFP